MSSKPTLPAVAAVIPFIAGLLLGRVLEVPYGIAFGVALVCLMVSLGIAVPSKRYSIAAAFALVGIIALGTARVRVGVERSIDPTELSPAIDQPVTVTARIVDDPVFDGRVWRFGVRADWIRADTTLIVGRIPLYVRVDSALVNTLPGSGLRYGARVRISGKLRQPYATTPGLFDYGRYLHSRGFAALLSSYDSDSIVPIDGEPAPAESFTSAARRYIRRVVTIGHSTASGNLMTALALGDRSRLDDSVLDAFQACGVVHVLAVSGLHVGIVLMGPLWLLRRLFGRGVWHAVPLIALAWGYAALTGMNPPVVRASIMATVFLLTMPARRVYNLWNTLALSALITLAIRPNDLFGASFQLSYAATCGILAMADTLQRSAVLDRFERIRLPGFKWRVGRYVAGLIAVTIAAQIATWPISAHYFGYVSVVGIFLSPLMVLLVTVVLHGGMIAALVGWIPGGALAVNTLVAPVAELVLSIPAAVSTIPWAAFHIRPPTWIEVALTFIALGIAWRITRRRGFVVGFVFAVLLIGNVTVWSAFVQRDAATEVVFLDVGQGDATLCRFPNGATLLVDGGPRMPWYDAGERTIVPFLRAQEVRTLDAVIVTHPDNDHSGGLISVLREFDVGMFLTNGADDTSATWRSLIDVAHSRSVPIVALTYGDSLGGIGSNVSAIVLAPPTDTLRTQFWSENDKSVVIRLATRGRSLLLTGDAGAVTEEWMIRRTRGTDRLQSEVLKVGHHGSAGSSTASFIDAVRPSVAVVSTSRNNPHGHPAPVVLERLGKRGVTVRRTDESGTLIWRIERRTDTWRETVEARRE